MDERKPKPSDILTWANLSRSILNGVVGDYLEEQHNPLAINMAFYHQNQSLVLDHTLAEQLDNPLSNKLVILVHGLTNLETVWDIKPEPTTQTTDKDKECDKECDAESFSDNYGLRLQKDFGLTPFYLRYNTGLAVLDNGQKFDDLLNELVLAYPMKVDEIVLIGFSMGGLLSRSAQKHAADKGNSSWLDKLSDCFYIGTPHEGSPLEKFGHLTSSIVRMVPKEYISHWADWIDLRSEGIKDLREGLLNLKTGKAKGKDSGEDDYEQSVKCGSFYADAQHYFVSGTVSRDKDSWVNKVMGDSLVKKSSANPRSAPENSQYAHFDGMPHIPLAHSEKVYQQLTQWLNARGRNVDLQYFSMTDEKANTSRKRGLSPQEIFSGCLDLLTTAYQQTVNSVETVHHSIAGEPFSVLKKIPVVSDFSKPIETVHKEILDTIYFSIKEGGRFVDKGVKLLDKGAKLFKPNDDQN